MLQLKDGENQVLAGLISNEDRSSGSKVPGVGDLPIVGRLFGTQSDSSGQDRDRAVDHAAPGAQDPASARIGIRIRRRHRGELPPPSRQCRTPAGADADDGRAACDTGPGAASDGDDDDGHDAGRTAAVAGTCDVILGAAVGLAGHAATGLAAIGAAGPACGA